MRDEDGLDGNTHFNVSVQLSFDIEFGKVMSATEAQKQALAIITDALYADGRVDWLEVNEERTWTEPI